MTDERRFDLDADPRRRRTRRSVPGWLHRLARRPWFDAIAVALLALLIRALYLEQLAGSQYIHVVFGDARAYHEWAARLAEGGWMAGESFYQAPLYPYLLGLLYEFTGPSPWAVRVMQAIAGAATAGLLAVAGRLWFGRAAGIAAGLLAAAYPAFVFHTAILQKTTVGLFIVAALLALLGWDRRHLTWWKAGLVGATLSLLVLTRENALVWLPVLLGYAALRHTPRPQRATWIAALLVGIVVVLGPVVLRNGLMTGEWHLTTSQMGPNFYIGNNPDATGVYRPLRWGRADARYEAADALELAEAATGHAMTRGDASAYWLSQSFDYITQQPLDWLALTFHKLDLLLGYVELGDTEDQYTHGSVAPVLGYLNPVLHFGTLLPLAILGLAVHARRWRKHALLLALLISYAAAVVAFYVMARYRLPLAPLLILYAAAALDINAWRQSITHAKPLLIAGVVLAVFAAVVTNRPAYPIATIRATTESNVGVYFAEQGDPDRAIKHLQAAVRHNPDLAEAYNNLGAVFARFGRPDLAVVAFEEAVRLSHGAEGPRRNLERARQQLDASRPATPPP